MEVVSILRVEFTFLVRSMGASLPTERADLGLLFCASFGEGNVRRGNIRVSITSSRADQEKVSIAEKSTLIGKRFVEDTV